MAALRYLALLLTLFLIDCGRAPSPAPTAAQTPANLPDLEVVVKAAKVLAVQDVDGRYWAFRTDGVLEAAEGTLTLAEGTLVALTSHPSEDAEATADRLVESLAGGGSFSLTMDPQGKLIDTAVTQETKGHVVIRVSRVLRPRPCASNADCREGLECQRTVCVQAAPAPAPKDPVPAPAAAQDTAPLAPATPATQDGPAPATQQP